MNPDTTYEPETTLEDHFLPIDRTVWHIDVREMDYQKAKEVVENFKKELNQKRTPAKTAERQHVYVPVPVSDCLVDNTPSWSRSKDDGATVTHEMEHEVMGRIKAKMEKIERIDNLTWGLYYGALDVWSIITSAFWKVAGVLNAIRVLAVVRVRRYFGKKIGKLSASINNEQKENREPRGR